MTTIKDKSEDLDIDLEAGLRADPGLLADQIAHMQERIRKVNDQMAGLAKLRAEYQRQLSGLKSDMIEAMREIDQ